MAIQNKKQSFTKFLSISAFAMMAGLVLSSQSLYSIAYAQSDMFGASREQIINTSYSGPVFLDSFWTSSSSSSNTSDGSEIEVGPGDGASTLAVVLVNRGLSDITAIKGHLALPDGFRASDKGSTSATATFNEIVTQGNTFTLFFDVDVLDSANVGSHTGQLTVEYSRVFESGQPRLANISVPFQLTGKVILDTVAQDQGVLPGVANKISISILNTGSADATGVVASITGISGLASSTSADSGASQQSLAGSASVVNVGTRTFNVGTIPAGSSSTITPLIYPSDSAGGTVQNIILEMTYSDATGNRRTTTSQAGIVVSLNSPQSPIKISMNYGNASSSITAGKVQGISLNIENGGQTPAKDLVVTLTSKSDSVEILGDSKWTESSLDSGSQTNMKTEIFASESLIGTPTSFDVGIQYTLDGEPKSETINIGSYIDGEINIRAYDLSVNYIGDTANVLGNLLNEGNTLALFTTVELVQPESTEKRLAATLPAPQYLGDLTENSPLPFSIPIEIADGTPAGEYPVTLKITYKDNLRTSHELVVNGTVDFVPKIATGNSQDNSSLMPMTALIAAIAAAIIIVAIILLVRKKRSGSKLPYAGNGKTKGGGPTADDDDIEALLNSSISAKKEEQQQKKNLRD